MKQTAVEWLEEQMKTWGNLPIWMRDDIVKKAKEMEKEQIIESFSLGIISHHDAFKNQNKWDNGEHYYNETYKSE